MIYEYGCVHGRFQIFHNDHRRYLKMAYGRCRQLIVGITGIPCLPGDSARPGSSHRVDDKENPFTYRERVRP